MAGGDAPSDLTAALKRVAEGKEDLGAVLLPRVYDVLKSIAAARMAEERPGHTLEPTALVHEAYLRLLGNTRIAWSSRAHFYAAAAEAMRRVLIDHARARGRKKRAPARARLPLNVADLAATDDPERILAVDEAIRRLEEEDARAAQIVRLRFYAGLSLEETAKAIGTPERTVRREWSYARVRLFRLLGGSSAEAER